MRRLFDRFSRRHSTGTQDRRPRLFLEAAPDVIYAVGDVHGCFDLLARLEEKIIRDSRAISGEKWIVLLGDYVDRGPRSAEVLDHLMLPPPPGFSRHCLAGNHETMMLSYLLQPDPNHLWLGLGGRDTLLSYGIDESNTQRRSSMQALLGSHIPSEHIDLLKSAPSMISVPGFVFVHGGIRSGVPLDQQSDHDLLWMRPDDSQNTPATDLVVVHGHTPVPAVEVLPGRINVDTGAYATGILSAVKLARDGEVTLLTSD